MGLDRKKCIELSDEYPEVRDCISQSTDKTNALPSYEYLFKLKGIIPKELYAYYFRTILQMNTRNVSVDLRLKMFEGVDPGDIMFQDELDAINGFDDYITVYRGTSKDELTPGLSWSRRRDIAESSISRGRLFIATIPKSSILLYFSHEQDEEEIIAHVTSDYEIVDY